MRSSSLLALRISISLNPKNMSSLRGLNTPVLKKGDAAPPAPAPGQVRVYNMRFCPWAERVVLTLAAKGIPAEVVNINLAEKPEWYFEKHPEGKVPSLEVDGEVTIESGLIPEYLDDRFPENRILPEDAFKKFQQKLLVEQLSVLAPSFYGLMAAVKDPSVAEEKFAAVKTAFEKAENLLQGEFYGGSSLGYADLLWFPFFERHFWFAELGKSPLDSAGFPGKQYPKLQKYFETVANHPLLKGALIPTDVAKTFIAGFAAGKPDYDAGL